MCSCCPYYWKSNNRGLNCGAGTTSRSACFSTMGAGRHCPEEEGLLGEIHTPGIQLGSQIWICKGHCQGSNWWGKHLCFLLKTRSLAGKFWLRRIKGRKISFREDPMEGHVLIHPAWQRLADSEQHVVQCCGRQPKSRLSRRQGIPNWTHFELKNFRTMPDGIPDSCF